jgi:hypothetical protein
MPAAIILLLALAMPAWLAALLVAVVAGAGAVALATLGRGQVRRATPPVPQEAAESVRQDIEVVKESAKR